MTGNTYTIRQVLLLHDIGLPEVPATSDTMTDDARDAGLIWACLGCGSVAGINPREYGESPIAYENARRTTRDSLDSDYFGDCCPDSDCVVY